MEMDGRWGANQAMEQSQDPIPVNVRVAQVLDDWIKDGWLIPYLDQKCGPPRGLIPLMAILQQSKLKVWSVMDYCELNQYIEVYMADAIACTSKLREWRQKGSNVSLLDLRKAYLQVWVDETLWPFQRVVFCGKRYCLTRLSFGLNVVLQIMKTTVSAALSQEETVEKAMSVYLDDIYINEDVNPANLSGEVFSFRPFLTWLDPLDLYDLVFMGYLKPIRMGYHLDLYYQWWALHSLKSPSGLTGYCNQCLCIIVHIV